MGNRAQLPGAGSAAACRQAASLLGERSREPHAELPAATPCRAVPQDGFQSRAGGGSRPWQASSITTQQLSSERCDLFLWLPRRDASRHSGANLRSDGVSSIFMRPTSKLPCLALRPRRLPARRYSTFMNRTTGIRQSPRLLY